jgi:hypothetical protein
MQKPYTQVGAVIRTLIAANARNAVYYVSPKETIRVTRQHPRNNPKGEGTFLVTVGRPNYAAREFIKQAKRAGEPFPIKKVQLKFLKAA